MRRAARLDDNHKAIVAALRAVGCEVLSLAAVGSGCPDLLVLRPNALTLLLLECKDGSKPPSERRLTPDQQKFHAHWPVTVVESVDDALAAVAWRMP